MSLRRTTSGLKLVGRRLGRAAKREARLFAHIRRTDLHVAADEASIHESLREEGLVDVAEHLLVHAAGVVVELADLGHGNDIVVIEGLVRDVVAVHAVAEVDVVAGVQDVRVPERIDLVGDGVLVGRVEQRDGVVLLESENALIEVLVVDLPAFLGEHLGSLLADATEVGVVDFHHALPLQNAERAGDGGEQLHDDLHGSRRAATKISYCLKKFNTVLHIHNI
jgi:hypothetical protein